MHVGEGTVKATELLHDSDTKFTKSFRQILKSERIRPHRLTPVSPNLNAFVERFIQTLGQECLDHFIVLGEKHLDYLVREFVHHYHEFRPHQSLENLPPVGNPPPEELATISADAIVCHERLGSLLKHYERKAA